MPCLSALLTTSFLIQIDIWVNLITVLMNRISFSLFINHLHISKLIWIGLPYESQQMHWRSGVRRDLHGNDMRFGSSERIQLDDSWRWQLTLIQKCAVLLWTLPVRLRAGWLFWRLRFLNKP